MKENQAIIIDNDVWDIRIIGVSALPSFCFDYLQPN